MQSLFQGGAGRPKTAEIRELFRILEKKRPTFRLMNFREAQLSDIEQIQRVRHSVKENTLSDPALVTDADCQEHITVRGRGWVCEKENEIVGFAIADLKAHNIWALFVHPDHAGKGIGKQLHQIMMNWYFKQTTERVWLSTAPHTKAEVFYKRTGWKQTGTQPNGELRFEMSIEDWKRQSHG